MVSLHQTQAAWSRDERNRINENWQRIVESFSSIQRQINILAGGQEVDDLLARIEQALHNAEVGVQEYIAQVDLAANQAIDANNTALQTSLDAVAQTLGELNGAISATETATADAITAKDATIQATSHAQEAINDMQSLINDFNHKGVWNSTAQYYKNNLVSVDGQTYIALKDNINTLVNDGTVWKLFAAKGERGEKGATGAGLNIKGSFDDVSQLPSTGEPGDAYMVGDFLYIWDEITNTYLNRGAIKGEKGDEGESAYEIAVANGFVGTEAEWLTSLKGEPGETPDLSNIEQQITDLDNEVAAHFANYTDVKMSGAKGDGITDDTVAFRNAIDKMKVNGGKILIPPGNYLITSTLVIPPSVSLQGAGMFNTVLSTNVAGLLMFSSEHGADTGVNIAVSDFGIMCNAPDVQGFKFVFCNRVTLNNIIFYGCKVNIEFDRGGLNRMTNLVSAGHGTLKAGALKLWSSDDTKFGCTFTTLSNYRIENNGQGVQSPAIFMRRAVGVRCDNIITNDSDYTGICILLENDCQGVTVENSLIVGYGVGAVFQQGAGVENAPVFCTFSNVDFDQCAVSSIVVSEGNWLHFDGGHITSSRVAEDSKTIRVSSKKTQWIRFTNLQIGGYRAAGGTAILLDNTNYVSITDCLIDECNQGVALLNANTNAQLKDNTFIRTTYPLVGDPANGDNIIKDNKGLIGSDKVVTPTLPASGVGIKNIYGYPVRIYINGGKVSLIKIDEQGAGFTSGFVFLMPNETLKVVYTEAPSWNWIGI